MAVVRRQAAMIDLLSEFGADLDVKLDQGATPLALAVKMYV